ncbi:hypothetical protein HDU76_002120 [Blyttiomyces sp. JEL0837]|nr:hypothetical protein HDU76_002120 [Blyttiomyces sp. JEL0837]
MEASHRGLMWIAFACAVVAQGCFFLRITEKYVKYSSVVALVMTVVKCVCTLIAVIHFAKGNQANPIPGSGPSQGLIAAGLASSLSSLAVLLLIGDLVLTGFSNEDVGKSRRKLIAANIFAIWVITLGGFAFRWLENFAFEDSFPFVVVTLLTIGFGNVSPKTMGGKIFLFIYFLMGTGVIAFFLGAVENYMLERAEEEVHRLLIWRRRRRKLREQQRQQRIANMKAVVDKINAGTSDLRNRLGIPNIPTTTTTTLTIQSSSQSPSPESQQHPSSSSSSTTKLPLLVRIRFWMGWWSISDSEKYGWPDSDRAALAPSWWTKWRLKMDGMFDPSVAVGSQNKQLEGNENGNGNNSDEILRGTTSLKKTTAWEQTVEDVIRDLNDGDVGDVGTEIASDDGFPDMNSEMELVDPRSGSSNSNNTVTNGVVNVDQGTSSREENALSFTMSTTGLIDDVGSTAAGGGDDELEMTELPKLADSKIPLNDEGGDGDGDLSGIQSHESKVRGAGGSGKSETEDTESSSGTLEMDLEVDQRFRQIFEMRKMRKWLIAANIFQALEPTWSYLDSLYFCFVTITTLGYGDFVPSNPWSWEFFNIYIFSSVASFASILSLLSERIGSRFAEAAARVELRRKEKEEVRRKKKEMQKENSGGDGKTTGRRKKRESWLGSGGNVRNRRFSFLGGGAGVGGKGDSDLSAGVELVGGETLKGRGDEKR